jgi:hypothetical protein
MLILPGGSRSKPGYRAEIFFRFFRRMRVDVTTIISCGLSIVVITTFQIPVLGRPHAPCESRLADRPHTAMPRRRHPRQPVQPNCIQTIAHCHPPLPNATLYGL